MSSFCSDIARGAAFAALSVCLWPSLAYGAGKAPAPSWGETMYVGDSITHGVNTGSWRWAMHKILVDNGIPYDAVGYVSGNFQNAGVGMKSSYGGVLFVNKHSSQASARAWELSGRKAGGRFNNTNLYNWLGLSAKTTNGGVYTSGVNRPQTFLLLIGTNDLLSDRGPFPEKADNLLGRDRKGGDMKTVLDIMFRSNPKAQVVILTIPCWTRHANNNDIGPHRAVDGYNGGLAQWVKAYNAANKRNVRLVDVNPGMIDVSAPTPFYGCEGMFNKPGVDGLHPNAQGDLIMAGHVARALGYAGRSVGLPRKSGTQLAPMAGSASYWRTSPAEKGFCADVNLSFGDGAKNGWHPTASVDISMGDGKVSGTLRVMESCIAWNGVKLYSLDMSANKEALRVAYIPGNPGQGVARGFYVWLGDMLIGEALPATPGRSVNGVEIKTPAGMEPRNLRVSMAPEAFAPATSRYVNAAEAFVLQAPKPEEKPQPEGDIPRSLEATTMNAPADSRELYANMGDNTGAVDVTVTSGGTDAWCGAHCKGTQNGDAILRLTELFAGGGTVMGIVNAERVSGDVGLELSAPDAVYGSFTRKKGEQVSVLGAYKGSISGTFRLQVNSGTFTHSILGGVHTAPGDIGAVEIFINGGVMRSWVFGGGYAGSVGSTSITMTDGEVQGSIYGGNGGCRATIRRNSRVDIKGGTIRGDIAGGSLSGGAPVRAEVAIHGSTAQLMGKTIYAGSPKGAAGAPAGSAALTLRNVTPGFGEYGIDRFSGMLSGGTAKAGRTLRLENVQVDMSAAKVEDFDSVEVSSGDTRLSSLGGAARLSVDDRCRLVVDDATGLQHISFRGAGCTVMLDARQLAQGCEIDLGESSGAILISTSNVSTQDVEHLRFNIAGKTYKAKAVKPDAQAESSNIEPGDPVE